MKQLFIIVAGSLLLCSSSCKKDTANQLPPATQVGANTFGCLINGQVFTPGGSTASGPNLTFTYTSPYKIYSGSASFGYNFSITATDQRNTLNSTSVGFSFDSIPILQGTTYTLGTVNGDVSYYHAYYSSANNIWNFENIGDDSSAAIGQLTVTRLDTVNRIASGTFWFNAMDSTSGDTIRITKGRFDVQFGVSFAQ